MENRYEVTYHIKNISRKSLTSEKNVSIISSCDSNIGLPFVNQNTKHLIES